MNMRKLAWLSSLLVAASCGRGDKRVETVATAQKVSVHVVRHEPVDRIYQASGSLRSTQTAILTSKIPAYVREVLVRAGERVAANETLVVLESDDLSARLRAARAAVAEAEQAQVEARSSLEAAEARAAVSQSTYQRFKSLEEKRAVTAQEIDEVESRYLAARADRSAAEARVARAHSSLERARAEVAAAEVTLGYARIRAPFAGRVSEDPVDAGNLAVPGAPLVVLEQEGPLRAEVSVDESEAGNIFPGDAATIVAATKTFGGTVGEVFPAVDARSRAFLVRVELPDDDEAGRLLPGMFVRVDFRVGAAAHMLVPDAAIVRRGQLELVYVVEDGRARLRLITLGRTRGGFVEVLSGLSDGDAVIQHASEIAKEGVEVVTS